MGKIYKIIERNDEKLKIFAEGRRRIKYEATPEKIDGEIEPYFDFRGSKYFLCDFMTTADIELFQEFDGQMIETFFWGVLVRIDEDHEYVDVFSYQS